jgi:uncharacterized metal-binding protein YceD (DUF177 family)
MEELVKYEIGLKGMVENSCSYEYSLDQSFFDAIEAPEVHGGHVEVQVRVKKVGEAFDLRFHTEGTVQVTCDRCLDDMDLEVASDDLLRVKLGAEYNDDGDVVIIPEEEGVINVAWNIYEFIALSIPLKHVHADGECNEAMMSQLSKHLRVTSDDEDFDEAMNDDLDGTDDEEAGPQEIDPRWSELKKIIDNN